jgi:uridine kinase
VEPSKRFAHIVIPEGGKNMVALDMVIGRIQRHLKDVEETCVTKV